MLYLITNLFNMRKLYTLSKIFAFCLVFFNFDGFAKINEFKKNNLNNIIVASEDFFSYIPMSSSDQTPSVLDNDTFNGSAINTSLITISSANIPSGFSINSDGTFYLSSNVASGTYVFNYQICENAVPSNCSSATVTVIVEKPIDAQNDFFTGIQSGNTTSSVFDNDTLDGIPFDIGLNLGEITFIVVTIPPPLTTYSDGTISVDPDTPNGTYSIVYQICENGSNPVNCDEAIATIIVVNSNLVSDLSIAKTVSNLNASTGETIAFNIVATNNGPDSNSEVTVSSILPNGYIYVSHSTSFGSFSPTTGIWNIGNLNANESQTLNIMATVADNGNYSYFSCIQGINGDPIQNNNCSSAIVNPNYGDHLKLIAFFDANTNGIKDSNEISFSNGNFSILNNTTNSSYYFYGAIAYVTNTSNTYNLSFQPSNTNIYSCTTTYNNQSITVGSGETILYFPVTSIPYTEIATYISSNAPVSGFNYLNYIVYKNNGNQIIPSGTLTFIKDNALSINSISQTGTTATATGFTYNFTNLQPFETRYIYVFLQVPTIPTVALGQLVTCSVSVTPSDSTPANNSASITKTIVGSYDPNDITEIHGEEILHSAFTSNDYLQYTIRFENTGTANAQKVEVENTLHTDLDETTLRMIGSSHNYELVREGSNLTWTFNNIQLPPSVPNSNIGHGYIIYEIKPKPGYAVNDIIPNTAEIYFDFNPAIFTNTWNTEFVAALNTTSFAFDHLNYYPNPIKDNLLISNNSIIDSIEIKSILGQNVLSKNINALLSEIDLSHLSKGIYLLKVYSENQIKTVKILKE